MIRNKIYTVVEGHGEANRPSRSELPAIVVLVSRLLQELEYWELFPNQKWPPFRMSYGAFFRGDKLENVVRYHSKFSDCAALLILLDMDDDCPKEKASELAQRIAGMGSLPFSVAIVCAKREFEAWFLASVETIHDHMPYEGDPESLRDAKGWLRKRFGYKPTQHQAQYVRRLNIELAYERSRSFRRLYHAFEEIVAAHKSGDVIITPVRL